jgi:predicted HNH restriction endonuclease
LQANRARERDGFRCQICGVTEEVLGRRLDVHHRIPARAYQDASESNQLGNLVAVCPACHKRLEERGRAELPLFEGARHPGQRIGLHCGA